MAADLHDMTIQRVFALGLALVSMGRRWPQLEAELMPLVSDTDETIRELRTMIFQMSRAGTEQGFRAAVLELARDCTRALGFEPSVEFTGPVESYVDGHSRDELLAVVREALSNVARHARATSVTVRLEAAAGWLTVEVADDGAGVAEREHRGNGLVNLRQRAERLGGTVTVGPGAPSGTVVRLRMPAPRSTSGAGCDAGAGGRAVD
jgi:signal transduction histidine kinase